MKKILFAAFAASLLAAGCQKTEVYQPANSGAEMTFSTEIKKITKAEGDETTLTLPHPNATGQQNLQAQGFNIWAYADYDISTSANVNKTSGIFDGMENWYVGYSAGKGWSANKAFYWPGKGKQLHFFAVSGSRKKNSSTTENLSPSDYNVTNTPLFSNNKTTPSEATEAKMTITGYEVSLNANDDLMVADFLTQDQESMVDNVTGKVALNFRHTLSKVQFVFKTIELPDDLSVYIQKLTVTGLKNKGDLEVEVKASVPATKADAVTTVVAPKWSNQTGTVNFVVESDGELTFTETIDYVKGTDGKTEYNSTHGTELTLNAKSDPLVTWLMMPQTITDTSTIEVFYLINNRQFKAVFPLKREAVAAWAENTFTKYTITLSPNLITFDANVSKDWEDAKEITDQN